MRTLSNQLKRIAALCLATAWVVFLSCHLLDDVWGHPGSATDDDDQIPAHVLNFSVDATARLAHPVPRLETFTPYHGFSGGVVNPPLQTARLTEASASVLLGQWLPVRPSPDLLHLFCIYRL